MSVGCRWLAGRVRGMDGWLDRQIDGRIRNAMEFNLNAHLHGFVEQSKGGG